MMIATLILTRNWEKGNGRMIIAAILNLDWKQQLKLHLHLHLQSPPSRTKNELFPVGEGDVLSQAEGPTS